MARLHSCALLVILLTLVRNGVGEASIRASPDVLPHSPAEVRVQWGGVSDPRATDFVAIYTPADSTPENFVGFIPVTKSTTWQSGHGALTIKDIVSIRATYGFRLWRGPVPSVKRTSLLDGAAVLAQSNSIRFADANDPQHIHTAIVPPPLPSQYAAHNVTLSFMWTIADRAQDAGVHVDGVGFVPVQEVRTYTREDMCGAPANATSAWRDPGMFYIAHVESLEAGREYRYRVGGGRRVSDGASLPLSKPLQVRVPSRVGPDTHTHLVVYGDLGVQTPFDTTYEVQPPAAQTMRWVSGMIRDAKASRGGRDRVVDAIVHFGDISYARGLAWLWDYYFASIAPVASARPYMVGIGNHEFDWPTQSFQPSWYKYGTDSGGECGVPYDTRFDMPVSHNLPKKAGLPSTVPHFYSFDVGNIHVVMFSTENNFVRGSPQYEFIERDLAAVDRKRTPFIVFTGHRPVYSSTENDYEVDLRKHMRGALEPLLVKYRVDLCLWGHEHAYERTCPMRNSKCEKSTEHAPVHVVAGMAGNTYQVNWEHKGSNPFEEHHLSSRFIAPEWSMFRSMEFGFVDLVSDGRAMTLSYYTNRDGKVHDSVTIPRKRGL